MSVGTPKRHCSAKLNGEGRLCSYLMREGGRSMPSRPLRNPKSPPVDKVALVSTTVSTRSNSVSFNTGARFSGTEHRPTPNGGIPAGLVPRLSIQRTEAVDSPCRSPLPSGRGDRGERSEEHTSELQSPYVI